MSIVRYRLINLYAALRNRYVRCKGNTYRFK